MTINDLLKNELKRRLDEEKENTNVKTKVLQKKFIVEKYWKSFCDTRKDITKECYNNKEIIREFYFHMNKEMNR